MKTQFSITPTERRRFRLMLFILLVLSLFWFFQCENSQSQKTSSTTQSSVEKQTESNETVRKTGHSQYSDSHSLQDQQQSTKLVNTNTSQSQQTNRQRGMQSKTRLKIIRAGKLSDKRHTIGQDIVEAKTVYIMIRNMVDITKKTQHYPLWQEQVNYLTKEGTYSLLDYHKRFRQTNMRLIPEAKYHDSLPAPHLIVEVYLTDFCLAQGMKQKFPETYFAETDAGEILYTDLLWQQEYKKVSLTAVLKLLDYNCNLIVSQAESIEFIHDRTFTRYDGDRRILPREAANRNWQPYTPLRENEYVVMKGLNNLITRVLSRTTAFLDPLARKRANINVPDYSGTLSSINL